MLRCLLFGHKSVKWTKFRFHFDGETEVQEIGLCNRCGLMVWRSGPITPYCWALPADLHKHESAPEPREPKPGDFGATV